MRKNILKALPTFVFCGFIFTFMILWIVLPKESVSQQEKRELAKFPELNAETLTNGSFQKNLDTYLSDHTPARSFFVGLNADFALLSGRNGYNGISLHYDNENDKKGHYSDSDCIALGKDNYLFPKPAGGEFLEKNAEYIKEFAEDTDIPVFMSVIPSSGCINSDKLPLNHPDYQDNDKIDMVKNMVGDSLTFIDVRSLLKSKASDKQLYYRTDHHWTAAGAYECYSLFGQYLNYSPVSEDSFEKEVIDGFYGTSYARAAMWFVPPDTLELWHRKDQKENTVTVTLHDGPEMDRTEQGYFFRDKLNKDDKYEVYLDGNHPITRIVNDNVTGGKLFLVKDSYSHTIAPFLSQNFHEVVMIDLRYYHGSVSAMAEKEHADAVMILYSLTNLSEGNEIGSYLE